VLSDWMDLRAGRFSGSAVIDLRLE